MICHNSIGFDAQIKDLLTKSAFNMNEKEIDVWMKYKYDPNHMFCFWQDDKITSCLQVSKKNMMFLNITNTRISDWYGCHLTRL